MGQSHLFIDCRIFFYGAWVKAYYQGREWYISTEIISPCCRVLPRTLFPLRVLLRSSQLDSSIMGSPLMIFSCLEDIRCGMSPQIPYRFLLSHFVPGANFLAFDGPRSKFNGGDDSDDDDVAADPTEASDASPSDPFGTGVSGSSTVGTQGTFRRFDDALLTGLWTKVTERARLSAEAISVPPPELVPGHYELAMNQAEYYHNIIGLRDMEVRSREKESRLLLG